MEYRNNTNYNNKEDDADLLLQQVWVPLDLVTYQMNSDTI